MAIKKFRPLTAVQRFKQLNSSDEITTDTPFKPLTEGLRKRAGRNSQGRITMRRRGGGHKRLYRMVDFRRDRDGIDALVETIEYDPNRSANIALVKYTDGQRRYIIAPKGIQVGETLQSGENAEYKVGNAMPLHKIPVGSEIHNIELKPGRGGQLVRSAGSVATLASKEGEWFQVRMPSGEIRLIHKNCKATIGVVGNLDHMNIVSGSAGRTRWLGRRPKVRGICMNPVDHPHGGRSNGGTHPVSPWGVPAKGGKTRNNKRTDKMIVRRRTKKGRK
jgi:large subunit ribosomal protein L2